MTYETMDWEAEAKRVARAFGVEGECEFRRSMTNTNRRTLTQCGNERVDIHLKDGHLLRSFYTDKARRFWLLKSIDVSIDIEINWALSVVCQSWNRGKSLPLARALFHLDLLTPEVEAALQVRISAHQKMEWKLEYEAQNP